MNNEPPTEIGENLSVQMEKLTVNGDSRISVARETGIEDADNPYILRLSMEGNQPEVNPFL